MSKMKWVVGFFRQWQQHRSQTAIEQPGMRMSPITVELEKMTADELNYSISRFIVEVKKGNGENYPGETLRGMVVMLQLYFQTLGFQYKFLTDEFVQLKNTVDWVMKDRNKQGIGAIVKQAEIITIEEEDMLWRKGILGRENPKQLLRAMFYLIGLNFALRAGQEHRQLRFGVQNNSQLRLLVDSAGKHFLQYAEQVSKTNQGGLKDRKTARKVVPAYENHDHDGERCIVQIYRDYVSHCPVENRPSAFYLRPLVAPTTNIWYSCQAIGRQKLSSMVADICKDGGLSGRRTNHSLRATAATRLYASNVDEQLISEVTGHRSNAVQRYKRTSDDQKRTVNEIVQGQAPSKKPRESEVQSLVASTGNAGGKDSPNMPNVYLTVNVNTRP